MKTSLWKILVSLHLIFFLVVAFAGCGGSSNGSGGGGGTGSGAVGPSPGTYLWEFSLDDDRLFFSTVNNSTGQLGTPTPSGGIACNSLGTIPSIAVGSSNKFAFVIDKCFSRIHVYSMTGPGISLAEIPQSPFVLPGAVDSIAMDPSDRFLYALGDGPTAIYRITIDNSTGVLTSASTTSSTADLREVVADPNGNFVFANDLTGGRIFAYLVAGGASLSPVPGSPFSVPAGGQPISLVMASDGAFLYAPLLSGGIAGFAVNGSTGALANISNSPFPTSSQPFALAVVPSGKFLYALEANLNAIEGFSMDAGTGALTPIAGSPFSTPSSLNSLTVDPSGNFLYATVNATTLSQSMILGFAIASNGSLSALPTSPYSAPSFPVDVVTLNIP